jgi:Phosphoinositide phospholipase C, Ca2+-dependent
MRPLELGAGLPRWAMMIAFMTCALSVAPQTRAGEPRLNQIQVIGSHNSYHVAPAPAILEVIAATSRRQAEGLDYTHRPFADQFGRLRIRQIELDVFADPKGGLFSEPSLRKLVQKRGKDPGPDPAVDGRLSKPGMKVLHVQDADFVSRAPTFVDALEQVKSWSKANPRHVPIFILVELKDGSIFGLPTQPVKFDRAALDALDAEILSVFDRSEIVTPDGVRGRFATLPEAIRSQGWLALDAVRGRVMFALDNEGAIRDRYVEGHPALKDRLMFVTAESPEAPEAAWFKINDPVRDFDRIQRMVRAGFLVRTRADADTRQSRANDGSQRDKALASGAQFVSTDYAEPDLRFSGYRVGLPGGVAARANPVSGDQSWGNNDLESRKPAQN